MSYKIKKGRIVSDKGIPIPPRWFCDDLAAFAFDERGITAVEFFNQRTKGSEKVFVADMWGGFVFYIVNGMERHVLELSECTVMPYGFTAVYNLKGDRFLYEQRVVNNTVYISMTSAKAEGVKFSMEFYDVLCFTPFEHGDLRYRSKIKRTWNAWEYKAGCLTNSFNEDGEGTYVTIASSCKNKYSVRSYGNLKHILEIELETGKTEFFSISFADSKKKSYDLTKADFALLVKEQNKRYNDVIKKSPVLKSPYKKLNDFFTLAPLYHEACKVQSIKGAIRAKTEHYWIWGWDGMSSCYSYSYWNDTEFIGELLEFYRETSDREKGIAHWFARDFSHIETSVAAAQGFYINLLYQYMQNGGDVSLYYNFAKKIFEIILRAEVKNLGVFEGQSLFPDFRNSILETGHDISCFNNTSTYCAVMAMVRLAENQGDEETREKAVAVAERTRKNFDDIFFDSKNGFYRGSVDSLSLEKRDIFTSMAIKWDNEFCADLTEKHNKEFIDFFEKNFVAPAGIRPHPIWGKGFDVDANQAHCWWPSNGEYYSRGINLADRKDLIDKWIKWVSDWTDILMCPEGINCYTTDSKPYVDDWNAMNGTWQTYSLRAWYEAAVHSVVGICFEGEGVRILPYNGEEMSLRKLGFYGKKFDVYMKGGGKNIEKIVINKKEYKDKSGFIPKQIFSRKNVIEVYRSND